MAKQCVARRVSTLPPLQPPRLPFRKGFPSDSSAPNSAAAAKRNRALPPQPCPLVPGSEPAARSLPAPPKQFHANPRREMRISLSLIARRRASFLRLKVEEVIMMRCERPLTSSPPLHLRSVYLSEDQAPPLCPYKDILPGTGEGDRCSPHRRPLPQPRSTGPDFLTPRQGSPNCLSDWIFSGFLSSSGPADSRPH